MKNLAKFMGEAYNTKCPLGMKWDKKSQTCVPIITKTKYGPRWWGVGMYHHRTTNGKNGNGNGNGSYNGNGSGNGNGGNGHSSGGNGNGGNGGGNGGG